MNWKDPDFDGAVRSPFDEHFNKIMETVMSTTRKIYLSGKMHGVPEMNFPKFNRHAKQLRNLGYEVLNPAENPPRSCWEEYMKLDITNMVTCDTVAVLDDWKNSRGARVEVKLARELGLRIIWAANLQEVEFTETVLEEADRLVNGDRQAAYGHPYDDYTCVADMMNPYLKKKYGYNFEKFKGLDAADTIIQMQLVKISREANAPKRDNMVDLAGYAQCLFMVREREAKSQGTPVAATPEKKSRVMDFTPLKITPSKSIERGTNYISAEKNADKAIEEYRQEVKNFFSWENECS